MPGAVIVSDGAFASMVKVLMLLTPVFDAQSPCDAWTVYTPSISEVGGPPRIQSSAPTDHEVPERFTVNVRTIELSDCLRTVTFTVVLSPSPLPAVPDRVGVLVEVKIAPFVGAVIVTAGARWSVRPIAEDWLLGLLVPIRLSART